MTKQAAGQDKSKAFRLRFNFWLNMEKPEEELIADKIEVLKNERSFTSVIRNGIRLICDLREGNLDVLFELFPWVKAEFLEYMRELQPTEPETAATETSSADQAWLEAEAERLEAERTWHEKQIEAAKQALEQERQQLQAERAESQQAIQKQLARLEELLLNQGYQPITTAASRTNGGLKPIAGALKPLIPPAQYDDDDDMLLEVKPATKPAGGKSAAQNFVAAMFALADQKPDSTANRGNRRMKGLST